MAIGIELLARFEVAAACLAALLHATTSSAFAEEDVSINLKGLTLNGRVVLAEDKTLGDGVVLLNHGTLTHNRMEVIGAMQAALAERGVNSLAITLGLGLDDRKGMYDCAVPHTHLHTDALDEIGAWLDWLKSRSAGSVVLMGHSRGGNQIAWFVAERPNAAVKKIVLLAPATWDADKSAASYEKNYKKPLADLVARAEGMVAAGKGAEMIDKIGFIYCKDAAAAAAAVVSYHKPDPRRHTPTLLASVNVPVLVIAGSEDTVVEGLADAVEPLADGDKIRLVVVEDADHFFRDFYAEDAADAIVDFLGE